MSEKNEEIAKALDDYLARYGGMKPNWFDGSSLSWLTVVEDVAYLMHIFKEWLKAKDRDHEALIGVLVGVLDYVSKYDFYNRQLSDGKKLLEHHVNAMAKDALSHPLVQEYLKKERP